MKTQLYEQFCNMKLYKYNELFTTKGTQIELGKLNLPPSKQTFSQGRFKKDQTTNGPQEF